MKIFTGFLRLSLCVFLLNGFFACKEDLISGSGDQVLEFSKDTLTFDTVFSGIGSATSKILVYNRSNKMVTISDIHLAGGAQSSFRLNVDGTIDADHAFDDVIIRAKDSMYIFVEVNIDPLRVDAPVLVQDSIMFTVDAHNQRVLLQAFGQDIEILKNRIILNDTVLNGTKPYLVYGYLAVDSAKTLTLPAGCRLYFYNNSNFYVYGNLKVEGTLTNPVIMRGSRMDKIMYVDPVPYNYVAGQWGGVYLLSKEGKHLLNHLQLQSAYVGLYFYNSDRRFKPSLEIHNSRIHNSLFYNVVAINGDLLVTNSEITNSGSYTVYLNGGNHAFYHCTIANYFGTAQPIGRGRKPAVMLMDLNKALHMNTVFKNCIVTGSQQNEFTVATKYPKLYKGDISHSYIRSTEKDSAFFSNIRWYEFKDSVFQQSSYDEEKKIYYNFNPHSSSPARGIADPAISGLYPIDLNGKSRLADGKPDAGAYEWYPEAQ